MDLDPGRRLLNKEKVDGWREMVMENESAAYKVRE